jgi:trehalose 6-phosphate synthase
MTWTHLSSRLTLWFVLGIGSVVFLVAQFYARMELNRVRDRLQWHAELQAESMRERIEPLAADLTSPQLEQEVEGLGSHAGVLGVAVYDQNGRLTTASPAIRPLLAKAPRAVTQAIARRFVQAELLTLHTGPAQVCSVPLHRGQAVVGALAVFHDATYLMEQRREIWRRAVLGALLLTLALTLILLVVVRRSLTVPIARAAAWMRDLRLGSRHGVPPESELFGPLQTELGHFVRNLAVARAAADEEARLRDAAESRWTAERASMSRAGSTERRCSWFPTASPTYMCRKEKAWTWWSLQAAWSPLSSRSCAPATGPGLRTARVTPTPAQQIVAAGYAFRRRSPSTPCAGSG